VAELREASIYPIVRKLTWVAKRQIFPEENNWNFTEVRFSITATTLRNWEEGECTV